MNTKNHPVLNAQLTLAIEEADQLVPLHDRIHELRNAQHALILLRSLEKQGHPCDLEMMETLQREMRAAARTVVSRRQHRKPLKTAPLTTLPLRISSAGNIGQA